MAIAQSVVKWDLGGKEALNVGYVDGSFVTGTDLTNIAQEYFDQLVEHVLPLMSEDLTLQEVELREVDGPLIGIGNAGTPPNGGVSRPSENIATAVLITKGDSSSRYKGRIYQPGVPDQNAGASGNIDPAWASNVRDGYQQVGIDLSQLASTFIVNRHKTPVPGAFTYATVNNWGFFPQVGIQRRRRFD